MTGRFTIKTFTGRSLDFNNPTVESINIIDIVVGLGREKRFANQSRKAVSVAQHSILVCDLAKHNKKECLFHDAPEAYMRDVPKGLKDLIPEYKKLETQLAKVIFEKMGLDYNEEYWHEWDKKAYEMEKEYFNESPGSKDWVDHSALFPVVNDEKASVLFLDKYNDLFGDNLTMI